MLQQSQQNIYKKHQLFKSMFKSKEIGHILLAIIILSFVINFKLVLNEKINYSLIIINFLSIMFIIFTSIIAKKLAAQYYESKAEFKIWELQRFGVRRNQKLKKPIPAGIIIPFLASILTLGNFPWLAALEFDITVSPARTSKRHGIYRFSEMTDFHLAIIASAGVIATLILAIIGYLANIPELARTSIYYTAFSLLPISSLNGTKIFFGSRVLWYTLVTICVVFLAYSFLLV